MFPFLHIRNYGIFFWILTAFVLSFPASQNIFFDGLVFDKKFEIITFFCVIPVLIIFQLYQKKIIKILFLVLVILKIIICFLPQQGILIDIFFIQNSEEKKILNIDHLLKNKDNKYIINKDLNRNKDFPLEWINYHNKNNFELAQRCNYEDIECGQNYPPFENYEFKLSISSFVYLSKQGRLNINLKGNTDTNLILKQIDNNNITELKKISTTEIKSKLLSEGLYKLEGHITFKSNELKFIPLIEYKNDEHKNAFSENMLFQESNVNNHKILLTKIVSFLFNLFYLTLILFSIFYLVKESLRRISIKKYKLLYINFLIFFISIFSISIFINYHDLISSLNLTYSLNKIFIGTFPISLYLVFLLLLNVAMEKVFLLKRQDETFIKDFQSIFIIFPTLIFFLILYLPYISDFKLLSQGDDWWDFEYFAYRINSLGEYLRAGEDFIWYRPLVRWLSAISHTIFGQTFIFHYFFDIWSILLISSIVLFFLFSFKVNHFFSILASLIITIFYFGETFKLLIGRGLGEYYSAAFLIISSYLIFKYKSKMNTIYMFLIFLFGTLGVLLREDHYPITLSIIILIFCLDGKYLNIFSIFKEILKRYKIIIMHFVLITFGLSLIYIRNYYVSGAFIESSGSVHNNVSLSLNEKSLLSIYTIITGVGDYSETPRSFSLFLLFALVVSIVNIFRLKVKNENFMFSIFNLIIVLPYLYLLNYGYHPRYSIHLLPYSIILTFLTLKIQLEKFYIKLYQ